MVFQKRASEDILAPADLLAVDLVGKGGVEAVVARPDGDDGLAGWTVVR